MLHPSDPASAIPDLNVAQKRALKKYGLTTVGELLNLFPRRYDDYSNCTPIDRAPIGQPVTLKVTVDSIKQTPGFRRRVAIIRVVVNDESGSLNVIWFNQPWLLEELKPGREIFISGTINFRPKFGRQISNPIWEPADDAKIAGSIAPVYPLTGSVAQKTMRELMVRVFENLGEIEDLVGAEIVRACERNGETGAWRVARSARSSSKALVHENDPVQEPRTTHHERRTFLTLDEAYRAIHRPTSLVEAEKGRERLAFDELITYRLALGMTRHEADTAGAPKIPFDEAFAKKFVAALPFTLTDDQKRAAWASFKDMEGEKPMRRLLQGDVGSGKTVVAAFLMAMAYRSNQSAVLMAPTEILAKQHAESIRRLLSHGDPVSLMLLTSSEKRLWEGGEDRKLKLQEAKERIDEGRVVAIGTHALLYRDMLPPDAAVVVVDEQHRFGVGQREALSVARRPDGLAPHLLSMTATPIPRSLALTLYGDLDISLIRMKPEGRIAIKTKVLIGDMRDEAYEAIRSEVGHGHRAFVVCPLIEESDKLGVKSATEEAKRLAGGPLRGLNIGLLHGKMSAADKDGVMKAFAEGLHDVLVSTTVVEVGVDVPEATVIAIEGAERFGLAQLHQLRGRVGRSVHQSYCYLLSDADGPALDRLRVLEQTNDGFVIAEEDLKRRGGGNLLGTEQSGQATFRSARSTDTEVMLAAKETAERILSEDADLQSCPHVRAVVEEMRETSHRE